MPSLLARSASAKYLWEIKRFQTIPCTVFCLQPLAATLYKRRLKKLAAAIFQTIISKQFGDSQLTPEQRSNSLYIFPLPHANDTSSETTSPQHFWHVGNFAFQHSSSKAGRGIAFLKLAEAKRKRWEVLGEFAKYAFFWPDKEKSCF